MDIVLELRDRICSRNQYFLDDEKSQKISDLLPKARAGAPKKKAKKEGDSLTERIL